MVYRTRKKHLNKRAFTLIELLIVVSVFMILLTTFFVFVNPVQRKAETRDTKRLSDIATLDRVVNEYYLDNGVYPDQASVYRTSTVLPDGSIALENSTSGWIKQNLSSYTAKLPTDPVNDLYYYYTYYHDDFSYELNAVLEYQTEKMQNDGGNDSDVYELGNNLQLISP
jgi:prepilin-type N-terminal cleavage/methylation domain-containing protein